MPYNGDYIDDDTILIGGDDEAEDDDWDTPVEVDDYDEEDEDDEDWDSPINLENTDTEDAEPLNEQKAQGFSGIHEEQKTQPLQEHLNTKSILDDTEEGTQSIAETEQQARKAVEESKSTMQPIDLGLFSIKLGGNKVALDNAISIMKASLYLTPQSPVYGNADKEKIAGQLIAGNMGVINNICAPELIDIFFSTAINFYKGLTNTSLGKLYTKYSEEVRGTVSTLKCTNIIMAGLLRVEGVVPKQLSNGFSGDEVLKTLEAYSESKTAEAKLSVIQSIPDKLDVSKMNPEERAAYEAEQREALAQEGRYASSIAKKLEELGEEGYKAQLKSNKEIADVSNAEEIDGFTLDNTSYSKDIAQSDYRDMINATCQSIMSIYDQMFESAIALGKIFGALSLSESGAPMVIQAKSVNGKIHLDSQNKRNNISIVAGWFSSDMSKKFPCGSIRCYGNLMAPTLQNLENGYNYYPYFILRYALGFVKDQRYRSWGTFRKALVADIKDRLYKILTSKVKKGNGVEITGESWFSGINREKNARLINSFTTMALLLDGEVGLNNCQIRLASYYTFSTEKAKSAKQVAGSSIDREFCYYASPLIQGQSATCSYVETANESVQNKILDILYLTSRDDFLNKPSWAYQALGRIYGGGERPDLKGEGVPIGKTLKGDLVRLKMGAENNKILAGIFAGSRSGKGVMTLSILGAAYSGGFGVCYTDRKPDMAKIFWETEQQHPGLHTYAMDTTDTVPRIDNHGVAHSAEASLKQFGRIDCAEHITAMLYLKNLQLLSLVAQARKIGGRNYNIAWVIDEVTLAAGNLKRLVASAKVDGRTKIEPGSKEDFLSRWVKLANAVTTGIEGGSREAFGLAEMTIIMIGQNPSLKVDGLNNGGPFNSLFEAVDQMGLGYFTGRGLSAIPSYGTMALKSLNPEGFKAIENNRFFELRQSPKANIKDSNATTYASIIFKPFLTLNTDDIYHSCWTTGLGKSYGYDGSLDHGETLAPMREAYEANLSAELGDPENSDNGVVHRGTGFYGLLETYFAYIQDPRARQQQADISLGKGYKAIEESLEILGLLGPNNTFGYNSVEDFIYDLDPDKRFVTLQEINAYKQENTAVESSEEAYQEPRQEDIDAFLLQGGQGETQQVTDAEKEKQIDDLFKRTQNLGQEEDQRKQEQVEDLFKYAQQQQEQEQGQEQQEQQRITPPVSRLDVDSAQAGTEQQAQLKPEQQEQQGQQTQQTVQENLNVPEKEADGGANNLNVPKQTSDEDLTEEEQEELKRREAFFKNHDPKRGAVRQKQGKCEANTVDSKNGTAQVDSTAYMSAMAESIQLADMKFSQTNKWFNSYGSEKHLQRRQKAITKTIQTFKQTKNCNMVMITADDLIVNGISFGSGQGYGDDCYFSILDGFNFVEFFAKFNSIKALSLDRAAYSRMCDESQLGYGALEKVFQMEPHLEYIEYPELKGSGYTKVTRDLTSRSKYVKEEEKRFKEEEEAARVLEESFLFGGPVTAKQSKQILRDTPINRRRAERVNHRKSTSTRARSAAKRYTTRSLAKKAIGLGGTLAVMAVTPFRWFSAQLKQAKEGF